MGDLLVGLGVLHEVDRVLVSARTAAERRVQQVLGEDDQVAGPGLRGVAGNVGGREAEGAELRVGVVLPEQVEAVRVCGNMGARNEPERAGVLRQLVQVEVDLDRQRLVTGARRPVPGCGAGPRTALCLKQDEVRPQQVHAYLVDAVVVDQRTQVGLALEERLDVLRRAGERPSVAVLGENLVRLAPDDRDLLGVEHLSKYQEAKGVEMRNLRLRQHVILPRSVVRPG